MDLLPPSRYTFSDYSAEWPVMFEREADLLRGVLGAELVAIHHIGSTSVPGLAAKPVIDLMPLVRTLAAVDALEPEFRTRGYRAWGECGLPGRRYFTRDRDGVRTHNVHVYRFDDPAVERHLAFCAYLRHDDAARTDYETLKRAVYTEYPDDIAAYSRGKDAWIRRLEARALAWYRQTRPARCAREE
jgi:GrpB-like predicted nucleotidyltransferase (UPF0157 family)